jgi:hypothetical protein
MALATLLLLASGTIPLGWACVASRRTSLTHALAWAAVAYGGWILVAAAAGEQGEGWLRYLALCLTGCAGVAVLGARRPGVGAWNVVVAGLLVVFLLPLAEGLGRMDMSWPRTLFLAATLAVGFLNYLPTRLGPAAILAAAGCGVQVWAVAGGSTGLPGWAGRLALGASPWVALVMLKGRAAPAPSFDGAWLRFRDAFGALWAERTREQFNRAAANAGLTGRLGWRGLRAAPETEQGQLMTMLQALLRRFGPAKS